MNAEEKRKKGILGMLGYYVGRKLNKSRTQLSEEKDKAIEQYKQNKKPLTPKQAKERAKSKRAKKARRDMYASQK